MNSNTFSLLNLNTNDIIGNDNFAIRTILAGQNITTTGTNIGYTGETGEPTLSGVTNSAWWSWTATTSAPVTIDTIGSNFDTYLYVFTGNGVNALTLVASNDDFGAGVTSQVTFTPTAGTTYQIAVDGYSSETGNITLNLNQQTTLPCRLRLCTKGVMIHLAMLGVYK